MPRILLTSLISCLFCPLLAAAQVFPEEFKLTESSGYTCGSKEVSSWIGFEAASDDDVSEAGKNCTKRVGQDCVGRCMSSERPPRLQDFSGKIVECAPDANNDWGKCHCKCSAG